MRDVIEREGCSRIKKEKEKKKELNGNRNCNLAVCCSQSHGVLDWRVSCLHSFCGLLLKPVSANLRLGWLRGSTLAFRWLQLGAFYHIVHASSRNQGWVFVGGWGEYIDKVVLGMKAHYFMLWNSLT